MKTFVRFALGFALLAPLAAPVALHATPLPITGQFSVGGSVTPGTSSFVFDPTTIKTGINTQTGDFVAILGNTTQVSATGGTPVIAFNPYPGGAFLKFPNLTIYFLTVNESSFSAGGIPFNIFSGSTIFQSPGFADTSGTFGFSTQGSGEVTFSATGISSGIPSTSPIPEPASFALFGTAVLASAGLMRKRLFS
jgi:hypothetical protein